MRADRSLRGYNVAMPVVIDGKYLPARLTSGPMTDQEFEDFCAEHPDCMVEMTAEGDVILMPPAYWFTAARSGAILVQLGTWAYSVGGVVVDASGGFRLPSGARRSPDAAWISRDRIDGMAVTGPGRTWLLCPNFVVELKSESDSLATTRRKMREWVANGVQLAWLVDPDRRAVEVYQPGSEPRTLVDIANIAGEGPVEGFVLDLARVWNPVV